LIPDIFQKYGIRPKGIIHIGAHECEERDIYRAAQVRDEHVLWIEAQPDVVAKMKAREPSLKIVQAVVTDTDDADVSFMVTNNSQSSSCLPLEKHLIHHPHVLEARRIDLKTVTLPTLLARLAEDPAKYNFLAMDIQGSELHALRGMESLLGQFAGIYLEVNEEEIYTGCGLLPDVIALLERHGFKLREKHMTEYGWGDALFMRGI